MRRDRKQGSGQTKKLDRDVTSFCSQKGGQGAAVVRIHVEKLLRYLYVFLTSTGGAGTTEYQECLDLLSQAFFYKMVGEDTTRTLRDRFALY